jgi:L-alanine-DL-glutamate epimerase-like enolase superfamily enzyme
MKAHCLKQTTIIVVLIVNTVLTIAGSSARAAEHSAYAKGDKQIFLDSWGTETRDGATFLTMKATNGVEAAIPDRNGQYGKSIESAAKVLMQHHLFDHDGLYKALQQQELDEAHSRAADVLCWDIHARTLGVPLHELIGTQRKSVIRYGDARWKKQDTPQSYAQTVQRIDLPAVKLHIPGTTNPPEWGAGQQFTVEQVVEYLRVVREQNPDKILAYDPHPQVEAAEKIEDARTIMAACDRYDYTWIEAPLPLDSAYWPDYKQLRQEFKTVIQNEEESLTYDKFLKWVQSGAVDQMFPAVYVHADYGLTPVVQMLQWVRDNPDNGVTINLHYPAIEHVHLAFTMTDQQLPYLEAPWTGSYQNHLTKVNLYDRCAGPNGTTTAPTWPGIYHLPWLEQRNASR